MRKGRQKSFAVYANNALGSDVFSYPFFENRSYTEYSSVLLRYSNSDSSATRMRDAAVAELSEGLGLYYQAGYPILLYLNGEYWGHYNLRERANRDSLAQWEGITDPDTVMNWRQPLSYFNGKTAFDIAEEAYRFHASQPQTPVNNGKAFFYVVPEDEENSSAIFTLYKSTVGEDEQGGDLFEHIDRLSGL